MFADLKWLLEMQKLDKEIYKLTGEQRNAEDNIRRLKIEIEEVILKNVKVARKLEEDISERDNFLADIKDHNRILEQKRTDLENDKKTKKEHIRREIKKLEQAVEVFGIKVKQLEEEIDESQKIIKNKDKKVADLEKNVKAEEKVVAKLVKKNKKELEELEAKKQEIETEIRKPFLNHYNRIMKIRNGIAITYVTAQGLCQGCKIHVPYQFQQKIKQMTDYNICEGCGRIMVAKEALDEE